MSFHKSTVSKKANVEIVQISADQNESQAEDWAKKERFPFPIVLRSDRKNIPVTQHAGRGIPGYVLVDKTGQVLARGADECKRKIKSL